MRSKDRSYPGVLVSGTMEPGHTLLDSVTQMYEANQLKYVAPEKCVSRTHELTHAKQPTKVVELEAERLVVKEQDSVPDAQAGSGLLLLEALKRRGLALVFADCITRSIHEKYLQQSPTCTKIPLQVKANVRCNNWWLQTRRFGRSSLKIA